MKNIEDSIYIDNIVSIVFQKLYEDTMILEPIPKKNVKQILNYLIEKNIFTHENILNEYFNNIFLYFARHMPSYLQLLLATMNITKQ